MRKQIKKSFSLFIALCMCLSLLAGSGISLKTYASATTPGTITVTMTGGTGEVKCVFDVSGAEAVTKTLNETGSIAIPDGEILSVKVTATPGNYLKINKVETDMVDSGADSVTSSEGLTCSVSKANGYYLKLTFIEDYSTDKTNPVIYS